MREFICAECGAKSIDNSPQQNKKFCSKRCLDRYYDKQRQKPKEAECKYNDGVLCARRKCEKCGWNPEVEKARKEKLSG